MGKDNTTTTEKTLPPWLTSDYQGLISNAQNLSTQPYKQWTGNLVAPFSSLQQTGFQGVQAAQGAADPYLAQASRYASLGATPITSQAFTPGAVQQYENPYTSDVVNATMAQLGNLNAQQQSSLVGDAISRGAYGGDRSAIAQSALAGQQSLNEAPTIAGLYNQGYGQALGQFNTMNQAQMGAQQATNAANQGAAFTMGNLGNEALNTQLTGAGAALNAGAQQQQLAQEKLNVPYEQYLAQQAYPYQQLGFMNSILGNAGNAFGGTSTTTPGPNIGSQIFGAATAALPFFFKHGGGVPHRAFGGGLDLSGLFDSGAPTAPAAPPAPTRSLGAPTEALGAGEMPPEWLGRATHANPNPAPGTGFDYVPPKPDWRQAVMAAGLGMMAGQSPNAGVNIGRGALAGLQEYQHQEELDQHPLVDHSGPTTRIFYPSEKKWIDTGIPTEAAMTAKMAAEGRSDTLTERAQYHQDTLAEREEAAHEAAANRAAEIRIAQMNAEAGRYQWQPGSQIDPKTGQPQTGMWRLPTRGGEQPTFIAGSTLTGKGGAGGVTTQLANELINSGAAKNLADALRLIKDPTGNSGAQVTVAKERLASAAAKADPDYLSDPGPTMDKWRGYYGVTGQRQAAPQPTAAPAAPARGAVPGRPAGVPPNAQYSPSQGKWWWQNNGAWAHN